MSKHIVAFDVETTGLSFTNDYIIQLSAIKFDENFNTIGTIDHLVKPIHDFEIAEGALEKHGITKEMIMENGIDLIDAATEFLAFIDGCDMLSYNGRNFDVRMITKDFSSVGLNFNIRDRVFFDSLLLEQKLNPRSLEIIYKKYTGETLVNAHNALFDVAATIEIFKHQLKLYSDQGITLDDIMGFEESQIFCVDGMIKKDEDGNILFAKGKYKDKEFMSVAKSDLSYIKWFMNNPEFDINTKETLREYYRLHR